LEGGIEASLVDLENVARCLLDALGDAPAVHRLDGECVEDQELQGALEQVGLVTGHAASLGGLQKQDIRTSVDRQEKAAMPTSRRETIQHADSYR
jgi:hypothetical protein